MAVLPLKHPIEVNGKRYEALTVRRAKVGDLRLLDRSGGFELFAQVAERAKQGKAEQLPAGIIDKIAPFLARVADVDEAVLDALDSEDFFALFEKLDEVLPDVPLAAATISTGDAS